MEFVGRTMSMGRGYGLHGSACVCMSVCDCVVCVYMSSWGAQGYVLNENTWPCPAMDLMINNAVFKLIFLNIYLCEDKEESHLCQLHP